MFSEYDFDNNGYIEKAEMAIFIKWAFKKPKNVRNVESVL